MNLERQSKILRLKFLKNTNKTADIITYNALEILDNIYRGDFTLHILGPYKDLLYDTINPDINEPIDVLGVFSGSENTYFGFTKQHSPIVKTVNIQGKIVNFHLYETRNFFRTISISKNLDEIAFVYSSSINMYYIDQYGIQILKIKDTLTNKYLQFNYELKTKSIELLKQFKNESDINKKYNLAYNGFLYAYLLFMLTDSETIYFPVVDNDILTDIKYQKISVDELSDGVDFVKSNLDQIKMLETEVFNDTMYQKIEEICIVLMKDILSERLKG